MIEIKKLAPIGLIISSALLLSACNPNKGCSTSTNTGNTGQQTQQQSQSQSGQAASNVTISITDSGFSPSNATVTAGGQITWTNNSKAKVQVASGPHPTHTQNQEVSDGKFVLELEPGQSATVTVNKVGAWDVHDHLKPSIKGKVTVQ